LVATILSAQCTDKRVNEVSGELFARYPDARAFAEARLPELEQRIRSTGFFRNKAKSIHGACQVLVDEHGGVVPRSMEDLLRLPGVARKTANVVLGTAYGIAEGIVVDTHVARLAQRLGLSAERQPVKIEGDLMRLVPRSRWIRFAHQMVWHGRRVCLARWPGCATCTLAPHCPSAVTAA
jgi:endonuclease-3